MRNNEDSKAKTRVLFLCTGNSSRSQMAEGFARHYGKDRLDVYSAGISPSGVNPMAVTAMKEVEIDISGQTSKSIDKDILEQTDIIVTLCGDARENCPVVPGKVQKLHWFLEDPTRAEGTEEEIMNKFRAVRDEISTLVKDLVLSLK